MKKYLYIALSACMLICASCEKTEVGGTATQELSGQWYVTVDAVVGEEVYEDCWGIGPVVILTYNNNANSSNVLYVSDLDDQYIWNFKVQVPCSVDDYAFGFASSSESAINEYIAEDGPYDIAINLWGGQILKGAGKQKNGSAADSIVFNIQFEDDEDADYYRIRGIRYSGLKEND